MTPAAEARTERHLSTADAESQELVDYCARPLCRAEFRRTVGPGRRQAYCSEQCRRAAERELRQARSRLTHYERLVEQLRIDVAAFGPGASPDEQAGTDLGARRAAEDALTRVGGMLIFLEKSDDACAKELRELHAAVAPVILASRTGD